MITYKDVESKAMPPEKREQCKDDWFSFYVGRKLTYLLTIPFLYTPLTPNHVTFISIVMLIIGFGINCFANSRNLMLIAWLCYFLWSLLDGVDGNMARYRKQFSKFGDLFDTMGGYSAYALLFLGMGIGAYYQPDLIARVLPAHFYIICGAVSSLSCLFPRLIYHKLRSTYPENGSITEAVEKKSFVKILAFNILSITGGAMVMSFVAIMCNLLGIFTVVYFFLNIVSMVYSIRSIIKGAN